MNQNLPSENNQKNELNINLRKGEINAYGKAAQTLIFGMLSITSFTLGVKHKNKALTILGCAFGAAAIISGVTK